ncbi:MAG TPA: ribosomal protein S18-alanine N-acetyltransferase [Dehalococcoidales bacterium]|nr:ribosomal protein S18-alanine N-acetyltransferase [Dehalococcoidales bacterium]
MYLRLMSQEDVPQVSEIDREAFPTLWPPANYQRELKNGLAHYIVACDGREEPEAVPDKGFAGLLARVRRLFGNGPAPAAGHYIMGFVGLWLLVDEAHITNIAVREKHRRQGIGESLLIAIIELAIELRAKLVTLEVRASNAEAQKLYAKYGFVRVGLRRGYYTDNREDAVLMTIEDVKSSKARLEQLKRAHAVETADR